MAPRGISWYPGVHREQLTELRPPCTPQSVHWQGAASPARAAHKAQTTRAARRPPAAHLHAAGARPAAAAPPPREPLHQLGQHGVGVRALTHWHRGLHAIRALRAHLRVRRAPHRAAWRGAGGLGCGAGRGRRTRPARTGGTAPREARAAHGPGHLLLALPCCSQAHAQARRPGQPSAPERPPSPPTALNSPTLGGLPCSGFARAGSRAFRRSRSSATSRHAVSTAACEERGAAVGGGGATVGGGGATVGGGGAAVGGGGATVGASAARWDGRASNAPRVSQHTAP